jgi:hypothetical protein
MTRHISILAALAIVGCSAVSHTNDGRQWTRVSCSGNSGWEACTHQAEQLCPQGFDIANKEENRSSALRAYEVACKQ